MAEDSGSPPQSDLGTPAPGAAGADESASEAMDPDQIEALLNSVKGGPSPPGGGLAASAEDGHQELRQAEIDRFLSEAGGPSEPEPSSEAPGSEQPPSPPQAGEGDVPAADVEFLLNQAHEALESIQSTADASAPPGVRPFELPEFGGAPANTETATLDLIRDVELDLRIELGRTQMYLEEVLKLRKGSVVPLDKLAGDPVDIYVNGRLIARGEVLVLNDNFCVRVTELIAGTGPDP